MTLTVSGTPSTGYPTSLTVISDKRKHLAVAAVTELATITVKTGVESKVYSASRIISPAKPAYNDPITIVDSRPGVVWNPTSDDGITAVFVTA